MQFKIPDRLTDFNSEVAEKWKEKPYLVDVEQHMLEIFSEIKENSSLSKRTKRKIVKTFKGIFRGNKEEGSLRKRNRKLIDNFNYLYNFFNACFKNNIIDNTHQALNKDGGKNFNAEASSDKEEKEDEYAKGLKSKFKNLIKSDPNSFGDFLQKFGEEINNNFKIKGNSSPFSVEIENNNANKVYTLNKENGFKEFCKYIIGKYATNTNENINYTKVKNYSSVKKKFKEVYDFYSEFNKEFKTIKGFFDSKHIQKSRNPSIREARKTFDEVQNKREGIKEVLSSYGNIIYYGETFHKGTNVVKTTISNNIINRAKKYNKKWEYLLNAESLNFNQLIKIFEENLENAKTLKKEIEAVAEEVKRKNTKGFGFSIDRYKKNIDFIDQQLKTIKYQTKDNSKLSEISGMIDAINAEIRYNNSLKKKASDALQALLQILQTMLMISNLARAVAMV